MLNLIMTVVFIVMIIICLLGTGIAQRKAAWWLLDVILAMIVFYITAWIGYELDPTDPMSIVVAAGIGLFVYFFFISTIIKRKFFPDLIENNNIEELVEDKKTENLMNNSELERTKNKLKVLKELLDDNIISAEEFEKRKIKLIDEITESKEIEENGKTSSKTEEKINLEKTVAINNVPDLSDEQIIKEGMGNLCGVSVQNGKLLLTDERIIYGNLDMGKILAMGVLANLTKGDFEFCISLKDVKRIYISSFRLSRKILTIETIDGQIYKFAVIGIDSWLTALKEVGSQKNFNFSVEFNPQYADNNRRNIILVLATIVIILAAVIIKFWLYPLAIKQVKMEDELTFNQRQNTKIITREEAEQMVLNNFVSAELRDSVYIYSSTDTEVIDGENYYQVELHELMGHLMGIYYVEQHGYRIYESDYWYTNALELVYGELDKDRIKMISYDELKSIFNLNNVTIKNEIELFYDEGQYYYSMFCLENDREVFYWLEIEGDKLWKLNHSKNKVLIWEK